MVDLAVAVRGIVQNVDYTRTTQKHTMSDLEETQRAMFNIDKDLRDSKQVLEAKVREIDKGLGDTSGNETAIASRMLLMEDFMKRTQGFAEFVNQKVSSMEEAKPADGAFISSHLSRQAADLNSVKSIVQQMEARGVPAATTSAPMDPDGAVPFSRRMLHSMGEMYKAFGGMKDVSDRTDMLQTYIESLTAEITNVNNELSKTNQRVSIAELGLWEVGADDGTAAVAA